MKKKLLSIVLAAVMLLSLLPTAAFAADGTFSDTNGHWAENAIETWASHGVLLGDAGAFRPNAPITRAELAAVLNRVFGYTATTDAAFTDVPDGAWYAQDIAKLYAAGIMVGDGGGVMRPTANITREEAAVLIARAFSVAENAGNENPFPDAAEISGWASFLVDGMKAAGYISGYPNGNFGPKDSITRAEVVTILNNMIDVFYNSPGEYDGVTARNVVVRSTGVTLKNATISGNLYIAEGVADGDVTLENVTVGGTTYIAGGGENSIHIVGGSFNIIVLDSGNNTHLDISGGTTISRVFINDTGSVTHNGMAVTYSAATDTLAFGGTIDVVNLNADGTATVTIGSIVYDVIPPAGTIAKFALAAGSIIKEMTLEAGVQIGGTGKINKITVRESGTVVEASVKVTLETIWIRKGVTITIGGKVYTGNDDFLASGNGNSGYTPPTPTTYTVTVNGSANGNAASSNKSSYTVGETVTLTATAANRYSFTGWTVNSGGVTLSPDNTTSPVTFTMPAGAVTVTAAFVQTSFIVTYDGNGSKGGSAPIDGTEYTSGANNVTVLDNTGTLIKTNCTFKGWNTAADGSGTFYAANATFSIIADTTLYAVWSGDGSAGNPVAITTKVELDEIATGLTKDYILVNNIDIGSTWVPIGNGSGKGETDMTNQFTGHFEGNGHTVNISGFAGSITTGIYSCELLGLFGAVGTGGVVQNLMVKGTVSRTADTDKYIGGIAGWNTGTIQNCVVTASVSGTSLNDTYNTVGGIAGINSDGGTILNCYTTGSVSAGTTLEANAGGIAGYNWGIVDSCYTTGEISIISGVNNFAGGIVGTNGGNSTSIVQNCVALNAAITAPSGEINRITDDITMVNNHAIAISGLSGNEGLDQKNGALITGDIYSQAFWETTAGWSFGSSDVAPWKMGSTGYPLPILYW